MQTAVFEKVKFAKYANQVCKYLANRGFCRIPSLKIPQKIIGSDRKKMLLKQTIAVTGSVTHMFIGLFCYLSAPWCAGHEAFLY
jgi:hypothetical protein